MQRLHGLAALLVLALAGCGGGGGSSFSGSSGGGSSSGISAGANVAAIAVDSGPAAANGGSFNIPYVTVTVCAPGTSSCAVINDVLVDTGSYGLRLMASAVAAAPGGLSLPPTVDPANAGNTLAECAPFADGYTWGAMTVADVKISGEVAHSVPVNVIDDNSSYAPTAPSSCSSMGGGTNIGTVALFAANGVLGVGVFAPDCGTTCTPCGDPTVCPIALSVYYSCNNGSNTCSQTQLALTAQVTNPVAMFATDNNGVIVQIQSIGSTGASSATGSLVFGIGTQSNNGLTSGVTVLTADGFVGNFTTMLTTTGQTFTDAAFIDSGSNALFFPDSSLTACGTNAAGFYCPASTADFSAVNQGISNSSSSSVSFQIADLNNFSNSTYAIDDVGGTTTGIGGSGANTNFFDWGMPFFYGRKVYFAIDGLPAAGTTGPYYAY